MRMLKRTSKHHQPAHLAAAVALGLVVGLVPKANLLAVALYAALLVLPLHTWLAVAVSLLVASTAGYFDPLAHALGSWLLRQQLLRPLWLFLDNAPVLPWLQLHNTVVLGSLVGGVSLAGPTYLVSLRWFDRLRWSPMAHRQSAAERTLTTVAQPAELVVMPPPQLAGQPVPRAIPTPAELPADSPLVRTGAGSDEHYEPAHEAVAIINSWHMGQAADKSGLLQIAQSGNYPAAGASATEAASSGTSLGRTTEDFRSGSSRLRSFDVPPRPARPEIVDSLDLAHDAGEVLSWVDEMLEDCLSEDSTRAWAHDSGSAAEPPVASAPNLQIEPLHVHDADEECWLMETTIEVVRWGDNSAPISPSTAATTPADGTNGDAGLTASELVSPQQTSPASFAQGPAAVSPSVHDLREAAGSNDDHQPRSVVPFQQARALPRATTANQAHPDGTGAAEAQRGESLGYLLGHLRQEREGKSP